MNKIFIISQRLLNQKIRCYFTVFPLKYTQDHEWIQYDSTTNIGKIGITDYAQDQLGEINHVEFPEIGQIVQQFDCIASVESTKMAADVYTPATGEVHENNKDVQQDISLINKDAEKNWISQIKLINPTELDNLMTQEQYLEYLKSLKKN